MLVLWVVLLLTVICVGLTAAQKTETTLATNQVATVRFRALAEAGINYAALNLLAQPGLTEVEESDLWVPDGSPRDWSHAGETLEIRLVNEASLVDLNKVPRDLLVSLFGAAGVEEGEIDLLADAVLDWRDEDDLHLLNGAEDGDYAAAGLAYGAKDGPFDSVEELRQVLGFDRELYRILAPVLTVNAGTDKIDRTHAPALVLAALDGVSLEEMELRLEEEAAGSDLPEVLNRGGPLYRIRVSRGGEAEALMSMEALVHVSAADSPPFRVLWRRYGLVTDREMAAETAADAE
jgi:general secretion pathway protein K